MDPRRARPTHNFFEAYTRGVTVEQLQQVFTRDAREAYRFLARGIDSKALSGLPWHTRLLTQFRLIFFAFTLKLTPGRRALYAVALIAAAVGAVALLQGFQVTPVAAPFMRIGLPMPAWSNGALWLGLGFVLVNLLIVLEVLDRFSLKNDLEVAREIQQAMLPQHGLDTATLQIDGRTQPANTVGGDFYDILPLPDGRIVIAIGDVAGKGSPASLLMALLLAMLRTLVDEHLEPPVLAERLNAQIVRHAPPSRFITLFLALYEPSTGELVYVNAGQNPPLLRRRNGRFDRLLTGGVALGMFGQSRYRADRTTLAPGETLALCSDGVTEAENQAGEPFEEAGLERVIEAHPDASATELGAAVVVAVEAHARATKLADDLTILIVRRPDRPAGSAS